MLIDRDDFGNKFTLGSIFIPFSKISGFSSTSFPLLENPQFPLKSSSFSLR